MTPSTMRYFIWASLLMLASIIMFSYVQENVGYDKFHEISCTTDTPRTCEPNGRTVLLVRKIGIEVPKKPRVDNMRVEVYTTEDRLESRLDLPICVITDVNNFTCRGFSSGGSNGDMPPWHMVKGRLFNNNGNGPRTNYLNGFEFWTNRLTFGNFEH